MFSWHPLLQFGACGTALFLSVACEAADATYTHHSLAETSDAEVMRFMGQGKQPHDEDFAAWSVPNRLPESFWDMEPKAAALALLEANRSAQHREKYRLVMDETAEQPPKECEIMFTWASSRCYYASDKHFHLRVRNDECQLAYAEDNPRTDNFYEMGYEYQPVRDLRLCQVRAADARQVAQVIWWLQHAHARSEVLRNEDLFSSGGQSTADGKLHLVMKSHGKERLNLAAVYWAGPLCQRWAGRHTSEEAANFAWHLMNVVLLERLGGSWTDAANDQSGEQAHRLAKRLLEWSTPDESHISFGVATQAARTAGWRVFDDCAESLRHISKIIPSVKPRKPDADAAEKLRSLPSVFDIEDARKRHQIEDLQAALEAKLAAAQGLQANGANGLRAAAALALRQIGQAHEATALVTWAGSRQEGSRWASEQLRREHAEAYAQYLEDKTRHAVIKEDRRFFDELRRVNAAQAAELLATLPPEKLTLLELHSSAPLDVLRTQPPGEASRQGLLRVLFDPQSSTNERMSALGLLVPHAAPLSDPAVEVDDALQRMLAVAQPFPIAPEFRLSVWHAIALRGRTENFATLLVAFLNSESDIDYEASLAALCCLAQSDPANLKPRVSPLLLPQFNKTRRSITELFWAAWVANLRELEPVIHKLATLNAAETEDIRVSTSHNGADTPVTGRFHFARHITALWQEQDALTKARMLVAFAVSNIQSIINGSTVGRQERWLTEFQSCVSKLDAESRMKLDTFINEVVHTPESLTADSISYPNGVPDAGASMARWLRAALPK